MTITERIDRARRSFAGKFGDPPWAVILTETELDEVEASKLAQQRLTRPDHRRAYAGLTIMLWTKGMQLAGPVVVGEAAAMAFYASNFTCWA